jgi:predicted RNase H-like nuclease (RuvC/YqgF family)
LLPALRPLTINVRKHVNGCCQSIPKCIRPDPVRHHVLGPGPQGAVTAMARLPLGPLAMSDAERKRRQREREWAVHAEADRRRGEERSRREAALLGDIEVLRARLRELEDMLSRERAETELAQERLQGADGRARNLEDKLERLRKVNEMAQRRIGRLEAQLHELRMVGLGELMFSPAAYRKIAACLHPDGTADPAEKARRTEASALFNAHHTEALKARKR